LFVGRTQHILSNSAGSLVPPQGVGGAVLGACNGEVWFDGVRTEGLVMRTQAELTIRQTVRPFDLRFPLICIYCTNKQ
jgi:hypothetical protein